MPDLQISLFGTFQVQGSAQTLLRFPTQKVRALLAYLSVEAQSAHPREKLMALFWPEQNQTSASNNLRQTLSRLRSALPANTLLLQDNEVQFQPTYDYHLDVARFLHLVAANTRRRQQGETDTETQLPILTEATDLYRGDFLAHFGLPDAPLFEEWALLKREWLRGEAMKLLDQLTLIYEQTSRHEEAVATARRQLVIDSLHETAYQQLMRNLALAGRRSEALEQFDLCRRLLAQELTVEPAQETTELAQKIRTGEFTYNPNRQQTDISQRPNRDSASRRLVPTRPFNVPVALTPLVGREEELHQLISLLITPSVRLLTIWGAGGIGKTHLMAEAAYRLEQQPPLQAQQIFPDGIYWVAVSAIPTVDRLVEAIAQTLSIQLNTYQEPLVQVQRWLQAKAILLLLDNFEHLLNDGVTLMVELLRTAPHLKLVVTSRLRLQLQGEQLFPVEGLRYPSAAFIKAHLPGATVPPEWQRYPSLQLFDQQAQRLQPHFALQAADLPAVATICALLQGMPLGILLAVGWINEMTLPQIATQVQSRLDFLSQEWHDLPPRQQSMRAVLDYSWRFLSDHEQQILQAAALFRGGFTEDAAQTVFQASLRNLTALVNKSMLQRADDGRYQMHELLRQYAAEKLAQRVDQGVAIRAAFTKYFAEKLAVPGNEYDKTEQIKPLLPELENLHLAWQQILQGDHVEWAIQASRLYLYLVEYYVSRAYLQELLQQFTDYLEKIIEKQPHYYQAQRRLAWLLINQATLSVHLAQHEKAADLFRRSHELFMGPAYSAEESLLNRAMAWNEEGRVSVHHRPLYARQLYQQALPIFEQFGDDFWFIGVRTLLANLDFHLGAYQQAERTFREILAYEGEQGELDPYAPTALIKLTGLALFRQGEFQAAQSLLQKDLAVAEKNRSPELIGDALPFLATALFWCGEGVEAQQVVSRKLTHYIQAGVPGRTAEAQRTQATIYLHGGNYAQAAYYCLQAIETQRLVRDSFALGESLVILGQIRLGEERWADAETVLTECIDLYQALGEHGVIGSAYATLAYLHLHQGNVAAARQQVRNALQIAQEWRTFFAAIYALPALALLKLAAGETQKAIALYALVTAQTPVVARSQWFAQMAGRKLAARQTRLSPALVASAQKKGETADLWEAVEQLHSEL